MRNEEKHGLVEYEVVSLRPFKAIDNVFMLTISYFYPGSIQQTSGITRTHVGFHPDAGGSAIEVRALCTNPRLMHSLESVISGFSKRRRKLIKWYSIARREPFGKCIGRR